MNRLEKRFVNATRHGERVARYAIRQLQYVRPLPGWSYLDVGCGNGLATIQVAGTLGLDAVGVDVDPAQIALASTAAGDRSDVTFVTADATRLPFEAGRFNVVFTNKAMHHIGEWRLAVAEIRRVVTSGGYVVFADLSAPSWAAPLLRRWAGDGVGVFTRQDLDHAFSGLREVHRKVLPLHYEAVFVKP